MQIKSLSPRFYGVIYDRGKWSAKVTIDGYQQYIGRYDSELDAARAVNRFVQDHDLAKPLNVVEENEQPKVGRVWR